MAQDEQVLESEEQVEPTLDEEVEPEAGLEPTEPSEEETPAEEEEVAEEPAPESEPEPQESVEELKARLAKAETELEQQKAALREQRRAKPLTAPLAAPTKTLPTISTEDYVKSLVKQAEDDANAEILKEYPQFQPENDPDGANWNKFAQNYALAANLRGVVPVTKEQILNLSRDVLALSGMAPKKANPEKVAAEAKKGQIKAQAASLGTTPSQKSDSPSKASAEDIRAAKAVGMPIEDYLKNKNTWEETSL